MKPSIAMIADSMRVDAKELLEFALANEEKYGVLYTEDKNEYRCLVSTWHVNDLVADFRKHVGEKNV